MDTRGVNTPLCVDQTGLRLGEERENRERKEKEKQRKEKEESEWRRLFRFYVLCTYISRSTLQLTCVLEDRIYCLRTLAFVDSSVTRSCNRGKESHKSLTEKTLSNSRGQGVCCPFSAAFFHFSPTHSVLSMLCTLQFVAG